LKKIREQWKEHEHEIRNTQANPETIHRPEPNVSFEESDPLPKSLPETHHHISNTTRLKENLYRWVDFHEKNGDGAIKVRVYFLVHCKENLIFP